MLSVYILSTTFILTSAKMSSTNSTPTFFTDVHFDSWLYSITASILIGLSGIFPLFVVPIQSNQSLSHGVNSIVLRRLLSFAVGGLLGDVFLHLLPEAWQHLSKTKSASHLDHVCIGLVVLAGIFVFVVLEMLFGQDEDENENSEIYHKNEKSQTKINNGMHRQGDNAVHFRSKNMNESTANGHPVSSNENDHQNKKNKKQIVGYLNLMANSIDNFTHGLSVAGSFLVSTKVGLLTTFAILIHEIPHEIGDFAILLRSGFNRWEAAKAQVMTAGVGLLGAITALSVDSIESLGMCVIWILPFTAGGFLNIALVNVLPELLREKNSKESIKQMLCLILGVAIMAVMTLLCD